MYMYVYIYTHTYVLKGQERLESSMLLQLSCLLLIITLCFTCGERKFWSTIKMPQNIMNMIVGFTSKFFPFH